MQVFNEENANLFGFCSLKTCSLSGNSLFQSSFRRFCYPQRVGLFCSKSKVLGTWSRDGSVINSTFLLSVNNKKPMSICPFVQMHKLVNIIKLENEMDNMDIWTCPK